MLSRFRSLVQCPGWVELRRLVEAQALTRESKVLRTVTTPELLAEHNFMKGEATGMRALILLVETQTEVAQHTIDQIEKEEGHDDESA
jgi:hypothetical protein